MDATALFFLLACGLIHFQSAHPARILMTSPQYPSLILMHASLAEELVKRGHEVHFAVGSRYPRLDSIRRSGVNVVEFHIPPDVLYVVSPEMERLISSIVFNPPDDMISAYANLIVTRADADCGYMMQDKAFMKHVTSVQFDLAIPFVSPLSACTLILPHHLRVPFVTMYLWMFPWDLGLPALPSFVGIPIPKDGVLTMPDLQTFGGRLLNTFGYLARYFKVQPMFWGNTTLLEKFPGPTKVSSWQEILKKSELFMDDSDHHLDVAVPLFPNVILVAGVSLGPVKPLEASLEKLFADSGDNGVILCSFGSSASYMPAEVVQKFFDAFRRLKQIVIARFSVPDGVKVPNNVKLLSWLPQNDILGHPKTRLFITHCGAKSQYESLYHGVAMIGFPLFAEQAANAARVARKGFGLQMDIRKFTSDELLKSIREVFDNSSYSDAIRKMSAIYRDQPMTGRQKAAFWIEHVLKYGGGHLRPMSIDMGLHQMLMLDVLAVVFGVALAVVIASSCCIRRCIRKCSPTGRKSKKD